jgi:hypothetical protein
MRIALSAELGAEQSAVADSLLDRLEAGVVSDLQSPGQRGDRAHSGDGAQSAQSLGQQRVSCQLESGDRRSILYR